MIPIILISHGSFCDGLLDGLKMIAGSDFSIQTVSLYPDVSPEIYRENLKQMLLLNYRKGNHKTIILSDIKGGTPYQSAMYLKKDFNIGLISGMNLPMLLTLVIEQIEEDSIDCLIKKVMSLEACGITGVELKKGVSKHREKLSINKN